MGVRLSGDSHTEVNGYSEFCLHFYPHNLRPAFPLNFW